MTLGRLHSTGLCFLAFGIATACQLGCADRSDDDPGAGQTGSPVAPDYETPVPFRTLPEQEPNRGPSPEVPRRLLRAPSRIASFKNGAVRAVANVGGVGIVEVQADGGAVVRGSLLADTEVQWVGSVESSLLAIAERLPDDARTETSLQTSFYAFADEQLTGELRRQTPSQRLDLPGRLLQAKVREDRVIVLTQLNSPALCAPSTGPRPGYSTSEYVVSDLKREAGQWSVTEAIRVQAQGYVETETAFVLIAYSGFEQLEQLTVVELSDPDLKRWPAVDLSRETPQATAPLAQAPMALADGKLAVLLANGAGLELRVIPLDDASESTTWKSLSFQPSENTGGRRGFASEAFFREGFAVLPGTEVTEQAPPRGLGPGGEPNADNAHAVVEWSSEDGPRVRLQLPEDIESVLPMGGRLLGLAEERAGIWQFDALGKLALQYELAASPAKGRHNRQLHYDPDRRQAVLPYRLPGVGQESASYAVAVLTERDGEVEWSAGTSLGGEPWSGFSHPVDLSTVRAAGENSWWVLDRREGKRISRSWQLEGFSAGDTEASPLAYQYRPLDALVTEAGPVALFEMPSGHSGVGARGTAAVTLEYAASRLAATRDHLLAYELNHSNACSFEAEQGQLPTEECQDTGRAALATLEPGDPWTATRERALPVPLLAEAGRTSVEWVELVAQNRAVALLQHRGVSCRTESDCDALGIEYEVDEFGPDLPMCENEAEVCGSQSAEPQRRVSGYRSEVWLYPLDEDEGEFQDPVAMASGPAYGWITGENLVATGEGLSLLQLIPLSEQAAGLGIATARYELLQWAESVPTAQPRRTTLPGAALWVNGESAISIEPSTRVGEGRESVGTRLHLLSLQNSGARIEQTLELGKGNAGHRWASHNGYILFVPDDQCAEREAELVAVALRAGQLQVLGTLSLEGTRWRLQDATDELVRLTRTIGGLDEHLLINVNESGLSLWERHSVPAGTPTALSGAQALTTPQEP